jgi:hypothetical protein
VRDGLDGEPPEQVSPDLHLFGLDCNDLPTGAIAATIRSSVGELLRDDRSQPVPPVKPYTKVF